MCQSSILNGGPIFGLKPRCDFNRVWSWAEIIMSISKGWGFKGYALRQVRLTMFDVDDSTIEHDDFHIFFVCLQEGHLEKCGHVCELDIIGHPYSDNAVRRLGPVPTRKGILNPVASSAEFAGWVLWHLPSGKHTKIYGQSPSLIGKSTIKDLEI